MNIPEMFDRVSQHPFLTYLFFLAPVTVDMPRICTPEELSHGDRPLG